MIFAALAAFAAAAPGCAKETAGKDKGKPAAAGKKAAEKTAPKTVGEAEKKAPVIEDLFVYGGQAPELTASDAGGKPVYLADYRGRTVVLVFWSLDCDVCKKEIRELDEGISKKKNNMVILALTQNLNPDKNREAANELKKSSSSAVALFDTNNNTAGAFRMSGIPYFVLIDKGGRLVGSGVFAVTQKLQTNTFVEDALTADKGGKLPECEFAELAAPEKYAKLIGKEPPNFKLTDLNGNEESPLFYKGFANLLIVFWSPQCPHCRRELPRIVSLYEKKGKELNLKIVSVVGVPDKKDKNFEGIAASARLIAMQDKLSFPVVLDIGAKSRVDYNVEGVPSLFLVDQSGRIRNAWSGESPNVGLNIECAIEKTAGKGR
jgi:peroxiredoxin